MTDTLKHYSWWVAIAGGRGEGKLLFITRTNECQAVGRCFLWILRIWVFFIRPAATWRWSKSSRESERIVPGGRFIRGWRALQRDSSISHGIIYKIVNYEMVEVELTEATPAVFYICYDAAEIQWKNESTLLVNTVSNLFKQIPTPN